MSKRGAKVIERPGLSEEEIEEIREAFNLFDAGKFVVGTLKTHPMFHSYHF